MKTKVICAALLAMFAIGINANANTLTNSKRIALFAKHKAVNKKKVSKATKPGKKVKATKASKKATTPAAVKPAGK